LCSYIDNDKGANTADNDNSFLSFLFFRRNCIQHIITRKERNVRRALEQSIGNFFSLFVASVNRMISEYRTTFVQYLYNWTDILFCPSPNCVPTYSVLLATPFSYTQRWQRWQWGQLTAYRGIHPETTHYFQSRPVTATRGNADGASSLSWSQRAVGNTVSAKWQEHQTIRHKNKTTRRTRQGIAMSRACTYPR
jgi:hypothetical protein